MSASRGAIALVVERELREAFRRKSLWITAAATLAASSLLMILPSLLGSGDHARTTGVVGQPTETFDAALDSAGKAFHFEFTQEPSSDADAVRAAVRGGDIDAGIIFNAETRLIVENADGSLAAALQQAIRADASITRLRDAGLTTEQIDEALSAPNIAIDEVDADRSGRIAAASVVAIAVYLLLFIVTMQVANGVAIEKANRISEVLLAIVPARALLLGKVIGVGLTGLFPLTAGVVPVVIRLMTTGGLPPDTAAAVAAGAAWFALGAGFYLMAAGALGALVERQEEAGSSVSGLSILLVGSYIVGQSAAQTRVAAVLAFLPFSAPMIEPARLALGVSSVPEVLGSLAASAVSVVVMARLATLIYRRAVVRTGHRLRIREVLQHLPTT